ncbi:hypothetical protein COB57_00515 [Candidatus Peregrinibacteria bacterium]|nr:MAG: hypothetical protein COB57_00515 [Candidatus Peregrinibacteria bacterium]
MSMKKSYLFLLLFVLTSCSVNINIGSENDLPDDHPVIVQNPVVEPAVQETVVQAPVVPAPVVVEPVKQAEPVIVPSVKPVVVMPTTPRAVLSPIKVVKPLVSPKKEVTLYSGGKLTNIDTQWNLYSHQRLGFSIKIPKITTVTKCGEERVATNIPLIVLEDPFAAYITKEYSYDWNTCKKMMNTLADVQSKKAGSWRISPQKIGDTDALLDFVKKENQPGCYIETSIESAQVGTFDIRLNATPRETPLAQACFAGGHIYHIKYSSSLEKVMSLNLGQDFSYRINDDISDEIMMKSFQFLK